jgi:hypothetical protein
MTDSDKVISFFQAIVLLAMLDDDRPPEEVAASAPPGPADRSAPETEKPRG